MSSTAQPETQNQQAAERRLRSRPFTAAEFCSYAALFAHVLDPRLDGLLTIAAASAFAPEVPVKPEASESPASL